MTELPKPTMFTMQKIERNGYGALLIHLNADAMLYPQYAKTREEIRAFMAAELPSPPGDKPGPCPCVIVDMAEINYINEGGEGILISIIKLPMVQLGLCWVVALINVSPYFMSLLRLTRLYEVFPIYENADSAMADICQHPSPKSKEEYSELLQKLKPTNLGSAWRGNRENKPTSGTTQG